MVKQFNTPQNWIILLVVGLGAMWALKIDAGNLEPAAAPAPTMITLAEIESRKPISSLPFTIDQSGSYFLTGNLTGVPAQNGIIIDADDVTLDLNGFTLTGVVGSLNGISVPNTIHNLTLKNGSVRDWIDHGIDAFNAENSQFSNLKVFDNGEDALDDGLRAGSGSTVSQCTAQNNFGDGIQLNINCIVSQCASRFNMQRGISSSHNCNITECATSQNGAGGIITGVSCRVGDCVSYLNTGDGILVSSNSLISSCAARQNTGIQIVGTFRDVIIDCSAAGDLNATNSLIRGCITSTVSGSGNTLLDNRVG
jgi:hypothetical protein